LWQNTARSWKNSIRNLPTISERDVIIMSESRY
jgi:hypothetical protein